MPATHSSSLAVLIVGYKSRNDLADCFSSLAESTYKDFKVVFVENNSGDGSAEWVKDNYPETIVFAESKNQGFAGGNNVGLRYILEHDFSHVFILNPDTVVDRDALSVLMKDAPVDKVRQPLILLHSDGKKTDDVNTAGNVMNYMGFAYVGGYLQKQADFKEPMAISMASGAGACIPTAILKEVGLFAESFFMYHEDVDLFWRIRMAGYELELLPEAVIWHKYHFSKNTGKFFYVQRNRLFFILRCYRLRTMLLILPFALVTELLMLLFSLKGGWVLGKISADLQAVLRLPVLMTERRSIQATRKLSDKQLSVWFSDTLNFGAVSIPGVALFNGCSRLYWKLVSVFI